MNQPTIQQQELINKIAALTRDLHIVMSLPENDEEEETVIDREEIYQSSTPKLFFTDANVNT